MAAFQPSDRPPTHQPAFFQAFRPRQFGEPLLPGETPWLDDWIDGPPSHVSKATLTIDLRIYRYAKCGKCRRHGQHVKAQHHRRTHEYRIVTTCLRCRFSETF